MANRLSSHPTATIQQECCDAAVISHWSAQMEAVVEACTRAINARGVRDGIDWAKLDAAQVRGFEVADAIALLPGEASGGFEALVKAFHWTLDDVAISEQITCANPTQAALLERVLHALFDAQRLPRPAYG